MTSGLWITMLSAKKMTERSVLSFHWVHWVQVKSFSTSFSNNVLLDAKRTST